MIDGSCIRLFRWRGVPVLLHWSAFLLVLFALRSSNRVAGLLALGALVVIHELGHAVLVRHYRLKVHEIRIYAFGGECRHEATHSMRQQVVIAWGGVLAQLALFAVATVLLALQFGRDPTLRTILETWTSTNLMLVVFNLLPIAPLDGAKAWQLKYLMPSGSSRGKRQRGARVDNGRIVSLVDDALDRARADARRRGKGDKPSGSADR